MNVDHKLTFTSKTGSSAGPPILTKYTLWATSRQALTEAFPTVHHSDFYKKLQLYGAQRFWMPTWYERFRSAKTLGESDQTINHCWAALLIYCLDQLWPRLDSGDDAILEHLQDIYLITTKIKGSRFHGVGIAVECTDPTSVEGFIDIFHDNSANQPLVKWITDRFLKAAKR